MFNPSFIEVRCGVKEGRVAHLFGAAPFNEGMESMIKMNPTNGTGAYLNFLRV